MKMNNIGLMDLLNELSFTVKWEMTIPEFDVKMMFLNRQMTISIPRLSSDRKWLKATQREGEKK